MKNNHPPARSTCYSTESTLSTIEELLQSRNLRRDSDKCQGGSRQKFSTPETEKPDERSHTFRPFVGGFFCSTSRPYVFQGGAYSHKMFIIKLKITTVFFKWAYSHKMFTSWWFQPSLKICSSKWVHLPQFSG